MKIAMLPGSTGPPNNKERMMVMDSINPIVDLCEQLSGVAGRIGSLANSISACEGIESMKALYQGLIEDELEHAQLLTLALTSCIVGDSLEDAGGVA